MISSNSSNGDIWKLKKKVYKMEKICWQNTVSQHTIEYNGFLLIFTKYTIKEIVNVCMYMQKT